MVSLMIYIVYAYIHCIKSYFVHHYALKPPNLMGKGRKASNIFINSKVKMLHYENQYLTYYKYYTGDMSRTHMLVRSYLHLWQSFSPCPIN